MQSATLALLATTAIASRNQRRATFLSIEELLNTVNDNLTDVQSYVAEISPEINTSIDQFRDALNTGFTDVQSYINVEVQPQIDSSIDQIRNTVNDVHTFVTEIQPQIDTFETNTTDLINRLDNVDWEKVKNLQYDQVNWNEIAK